MEKGNDDNKENGKTNDNSLIMVIIGDNHAYGIQMLINLN